MRNMSKKILSSTLKPILKISAVAIVLFIILNLAARTLGVGYTASYSFMSSEAFSYGRGDSATGLDFVIDLDISFNPLLFPFSYLSGYGIYSGPTRVLCYQEENLLEIATLIRVVPETMRNIPYFLAVSFLAGLLVEELTFHVSRLQRERRLARTGAVQAST